MSSRDVSSSDNNEIGGSRYESVKATYVESLNSGYIPVPDRFIATKTITPNENLFLRLYYNPKINEVVLHLLPPTTHPENTPFTDNTEALGTIERTEFLQTKYGICTPLEIFTGINLHDTTVEWVFVNNNPALVIDMSPVPDPIATCGPGINTIGDVDDTTVFAVNNSFRNVSVNALDKAGIIDRVNIHRSRAENTTTHTIPIHTDMIIPDMNRFAWTVNPSTHGFRTVLSPTPTNTNKVRDPISLIETDRGYEFPVPNSISNILDLPQPRGAVWIRDNSQIKVIV